MYVAYGFSHPLNYNEATGRSTFLTAASSGSLICIVKCCMIPFCLVKSAYDNSMTASSSHRCSPHHHCMTAGDFGAALLAWPVVGQPDIAKGPAAGSRHSGGGSQSFFGIGSASARPLRGKIYTLQYPPESSLKQFRRTP